MSGYYGFRGKSSGHHVKLGMARGAATCEVGGDVPRPRRCQAAQRRTFVTSVLQENFLVCYRFYATVIFNRNCPGPLLDFP
jgi:hypothetical protein